MIGIKKLSLALMGLSCATAGSAIADSSAQAATLTNYFQVDVTLGEQAGKSFYGNFSYDDAALTDPSKEIIDNNNGNQLINPTNGFLSLYFDFLGQQFTLKNDTGFPDYPQLNFKNGAFQGLDFAVSEASAGKISGPIGGFLISYNPDIGKPFFQATDTDPFTPGVHILSEGNVSYGSTCH